MDYIARISESASYKLSNEYSEKYQTYNCISTALDRIESQAGGLYPVEVWSEVLRLEKLLLTAQRRDKFIAEQRTRLENKYRRIVIKNDGTSIKRNKEEAEQSVMCVLLALAMHLEACPDDKPNPHEPIIKRINKLVLEYDSSLAISIVEAFNIGEDEEEEADYFVPPHDPLYQEEKYALSEELEGLKEQANLIFDYFASILMTKDVFVSKLYEPEEFYNIWSELADQECIIRQMQKCSKRIKFSLKKVDLELDNVKENNYNLKLVLNIIGLMRDDIVTASIEEINELFFSDVKAKYMKIDNIKKWGTADSGIDDESTYNIICQIINKHRKKP